MSIYCSFLAGLDARHKKASPRSLWRARGSLFKRLSLRVRRLEEASHNASLKLIGADANALIAPLSDARTLGTIEICSVITHAQEQ
jgi:hypothetical protein